MVGPLADWAESTFTWEGTTRPVFRLGTGPGVVVVHEVPGITPEVERFARRVVDAGFTVVMPSLFGTPGRPASGPYALSQLVRVCIRREFVALHAGRTSPITALLRAVAAQLHQELGGPGVGAVGMCLTGGFALAMVLEPAVVAPVMSQPSLPLGVTPRLRRDPGLSPADADVVRRRVAEEELCVVGLRFEDDPVSPRTRFERLGEWLGPGFQPVSVPTGPGTPFPRRRAHAVLTHTFKGPGAAERLDEDVRSVIDFLADRLRPTTG